MCVGCPCAFPCDFPSRDVCPGVLPCLFPFSPGVTSVVFLSRSFRSRDLAALFFLSRVDFFPRRLVKHLQSLNFPSFLEISRPARSSSGFISRVAASLAVFLPFSVFRFRVPLMSYPARNGRRFPVVFLISRLFSTFLHSRAIIFLSFSIKITLIFKRSRPVLSHPVPPTCLSALYYL